MSYIEKNVLSSHDSIVIDVKRTRLLLVGTWVWGILGCFLLLIPTIQAIYKTIAFSHVELAVTKKKVIEKYGIFNVHTDEMDLTKIENITYNVTFWGKIFGYANLCIQGANRNNINFNGIKNAQDVRRRINDLIDEAKQSDD